MSKEMRNHIDKFKNFLLREQDENSDFEDFEGVNEYTFILYFDVFFFRSFISYCLK